MALQSNRVVTAAGVQQAAVIVDRSRIVDIVTPVDLPAGIPVTDFGEHVISPGVVDAHVHVNEPGRTEWEGFRSATRSAAAGGVTTIVDMPLNSSPVTTTIGALEAKRAAAAGKCWVDVGFYGGLVPGSSGEISGLLDRGALGIKAFLCDSGLDEFPASTEFDLREALPLLSIRQIPLLVHAELVTGAAAPVADPRDYRQYLASRPDRWECDAIALLIQLCHEYDTPIHIVHLATAEALVAIAAAKAAGLKLSVETCPHYLYFDADRIAAGATQFKCAPPIRGAIHRERLRQAWTDGAIDTIGSDHSPCPPGMKRLDEGEFGAAWGGISSLQLTLSTMWTLLRDAGGTVCDLSRPLSSNPAGLIGLDQRKGSIAPGLDADLVVWDPEATWTVTPDKILHRHKLTPYENETLHGQVHRTYVRGQLVYDDGVFAENAAGMLLRRGDA